MSKSEYRFGQASVGVFLAMLWFIPLISWVRPEWLWPYVGFLSFIALFLRPLLDISGASRLVGRLSEAFDQKLHARHYAERKKAVDRERRNARYRGARKRHPDLPDNW